VNYSCGYLYKNPQNITIPNLKIKRLNNIICSLGDFLMTSTMEMTKFGVEFGYENPQYNYDWFVKLLKFFMIIILISVIMPLIIPFIALCYLIGLGVYHSLKFIFNRK
jgi:hypothetical protein